MKVRLCDALRACMFTLTLCSIQLADAAVLNTDDILVADFAANSIIRVNPGTGLQTVISSGGFLTLPGGMATDANGDILVANFDALGGTGAIIRIDPFTGNQSIVSSGGNFVSPGELTLDTNGDILVADMDAFTTGVNRGGIIRVDPVTGAQTVISSGGVMNGPIGIAVDANGQILSTNVGGAFGSGDTVLSIDPLTGIQTPVSSGIGPNGPGGLEIESSGDILISDISSFFGGSNSIIRVDPNSGAQTIVSTAGLLDDLFNIALDSNGNIFAANGGAGLPTPTGPAVVRVDPSSGAQVIVSSGGNLAAPVGIFAVPSSAVTAPPPDLNWNSSAATSSWDDPANWTENSTAASGDAVIIETTSGAAVTGPSSNTEVRSLNIDTSGAGTTELALNGGGELTVTHGIDVGSGGALSGTDTLRADVNNGGQVSPGNSPGLFTIDGNYNQESTGALLVELGGLLAGTEYDVLSVTGTAVLAGTLNVSLFGGFTPGLGNFFDIINAETIAGIFESLLLPSLTTGLAWDLAYLTDPLNTDVVRLSVASASAVPIPATVWLFGSGLLGLIGIAKKRKVA